MKRNILVILVSLLFMIPINAHAKALASWDCIEHNITGTLEMEKICTVAIHVDDNTEIEYLDGKLRDILNVQYKKVEGLNGFTVEGNNPDANFHFKAPRVIKNETIEIAKFYFSIDIRAEECRVNFEPTAFGVAKHTCEIVDNTYYGLNGNVVDKNTYDDECNPKCEMKDDKYYDNNGHEVDKNTYESVCNPKCEMKDNKYFDKNGHEVDKNTYESECNPKCEMKDNKYFDKNGHEVDKNTYDSVCNPKCEMKDDKYYDNNGHEVDKNTYDSECNPKCEMKDNKYFDKNGHEVDKNTYESVCNSKCVIENDKYYDNNGHEVSEEDYYRLCPKVCTEVNNHYYDPSGNLVSKDEYMNLCGLVENPKTGNFISLGILLLTGVSLALAYKTFRKQKIYKL